MTFSNHYYQRVKDLNGEAVDAGFGSPLVHLSEPDLMEVERLIGNSLPSDYREFLRDYGGLSLIHNVGFRAKGSKKGGGIELFYGIDPENPEEGLVEEYTQWRDSFVRWPIELIPEIKLIKPVVDGIEEIAWPPELLPIAMDSGNNQVCLAIAGLSIGAVFRWINAPSFGYDNFYLIADSFDEFMQSLYLRGK